MITNEITNRLGPGPAAYDHLKALKKVIVSNAKVGPIIRKASNLNERIKKNLNVSSSEDLFQ